MKLLIFKDQDSSICELDQSITRRLWRAFFAFIFDDAPPLSLPIVVSGFCPIEAKTWPYLCISHVKVLFRLSKRRKNDFPLLCFPL